MIFADVGPCYIDPLVLAIMAEQAVKPRDTFDVVDHLVASRLELVAEVFTISARVILQDVLYQHVNEDYKNKMDNSLGKPWFVDTRFLLCMSGR